VYVLNRLFGKRWYLRCKQFEILKGNADTDGDYLTQLTTLEIRVDPGFHYLNSVFTHWRNAILQTLYMVKHVFDIQFVGDESWIWLVEPPFLRIEKGETMSDFIRRTFSILRHRIYAKASLSQDPTRVSSPRAAKFTACGFTSGLMR
jgi:hypothetical protein